MVGNSLGAKLDAGVGSLAEDFELDPELEIAELLAGAAELVVRHGAFEAAADDGPLVDAEIIAIGVPAVERFTVEQQLAGCLRPAVRRPAVRRLAPVQRWPAAAGRQSSARRRARNGAWGHLAIGLSAGRVRGSMRRPTSRNLSFPRIALPGRKGRTRKMAACAPRCRTLLASGCWTQDRAGGDGLPGAGQALGRGRESQHVERALLAAARDVAEQLFDCSQPRSAAAGEC